MFKLIRALFQIHICFHLRCNFFNLSLFPTPFVAIERAELLFVGKSYMGLFIFSLFAFVVRDLGS